MSKKVLYIAVNSKPEELSTSKTVARLFINKYKEKNPEDIIEEIDLYTANIPILNYKMVSGRATLVCGEAYDALSDEEKGQVDRVYQLCDQFLAADKYIISAPMWSVFFPGILKQYLDCIIIDEKSIEISTDKVKGLLDDKERKMVYIQSSGGVYPAILSYKVNHGSQYLEDIFKFLGISSFRKIMVEGVDMESVGKEKAIEEAKEDIEHVIKRF